MSNGFFYTRSRLPFARPQTLHTLQNPPNPPKVRPAPQGTGTPTSPTRATLARKSHHKATAMAQGHPTAAAMASYTRSRLPFARPQTLQNPPNPPKVRPAPQGTGTPTSPTRATLARKSHHKATAMAQEHPTAAAMASFIRVQGCRLPGLKLSIPSKTLQTLQKSGQLRKEKVPQQAQHAPLPHAKATTRPQQWLKSTPRPLLPHAKATTRPQQWLKSTTLPQQWLLLYAFKAAVCQASNPPKPSKPSKSPASSAGHRYPNKPLPHAKATTRPQQWLKGTPRPQQWLLIRVQGCRLPGLKPSKTLQTLQKSGQLRREQVPQQAQHAPLSHAKATTRPQQWLKSTPRPQQWLLLYAFKAAVCQASNSPYPPKPSKPSKSPASSAGKRYTPTSPTRATPARKSHHKATAMAQEHPTAAAMASYRRTRANPARKSHHKATAMAQWHPTAAAMASYTRSRLPFARPQTLQNPPNLPNPPKVRPAPQGTGTPTSPTRATLARKSHHKATAMAQEHPAAAAMASFIRVQGCRLPGLKPSKTLQTLQTLQKSGQLRREQVPQQAQHAPLSHAKATTRPQQWLKSTPRPQQWLLLYAFKAAVCQASNSPYRPKPSKPSKSPASSAGKRYPNKPNTRHSRTQKPPQGHSNGSRAPHGRYSRTQKPPQGHSNGSRAPHFRSNGFFYTRSRLPFARPQTLQNLQKSGQLRREQVPQQATPARKSHHKATAMAQGHPTAAAMASYTRSRLPFARPQTLQNPPNLPNPPKVRPAPQGTGTPTSPTRATLARKSHHKATAMAQEHPTAAAMASFIRVQGCRLPGLKLSIPSKTLQKSGQLRREKVPQQAQHAPLSHAKATTRPQQWLKSTPRPQQWLLIGVHAPLPHAKATTRPQQWLKGTPRPQQWLLIRVQGCRLPGLKPSKTLQTLQKSGQLRREQVPQQAQHAPLSHAKATTRPQQWLKSTPRPQQWLLLYAFKAAVCQASNSPYPPKPSKPSKSPASSAGKRYPNKPNTRHSRTQKPPQGHSNGSRAPHGRSNGFFYTRSRLPFARLQTLQNPPNPPKVRPAPQGKGTPTSPTRATPARKSHHKATAMAPKHPTAAAMASYRRARATPARKSHHKATAMAQGHPTAAAMASYTRSRLPFARPQTLQNLPNPPNPPKVRPAPQGTGTPTSPTRATLARKSHHKATAMAQEHPTAAAMASFIRVQGCRLPGLKLSIPSKTLQTLQKSGQLRREKVPQQAQHAPLPHAKATTRPQQWLKSTPRPQQWLLLYAFKAAVCQASNPPNLPNPPKVRPAPQGKGTPTPNRLEKQTAICVSCCPSPSLSLQYSPSN